MSEHVFTTTICDETADMLSVIAAGCNQSLDEFLRSALIAGLETAIADARADGMMPNARGRCEPMDDIPF